MSQEAPAGDGPWKAEEHYAKNMKLAEKGPDPRQANRPRIGPRRTRASDTSNIVQPDVDFNKERKRL